MFDGTRPAPYLETDEPNRLGAYGRSKPAGNQAIQLEEKAFHTAYTPAQVLAVNVSESPQRVAGFFDMLGIAPDFQVLYDSDGEAASARCVYAVPSD